MTIYHFLMMVCDVTLRRIFQWSLLDLFDFCYSPIDGAVLVLPAARHQMALATSASCKNLPGFY
jgi:hypothetical protein